MCGIPFECSQAGQETKMSLQSEMSHPESDTQTHWVPPQMLHVGNSSIFIAIETLILNI